MGLILSEIHLHFYQKIKNAICKSKDILKLSQAVFSKAILERS